MSDLQISLIIIGALVVGAVYLFNWFQERRYLHKMEQAFEAQEKARPAVAPVQEPVSAARVEPFIEPVAPEEEPAAAIVAPSSELKPREAEKTARASQIEPVLTALAPATPAHREPARGGAKAPDIDYRARLTATHPVEMARLTEIGERVAGIGKPVRVEIREEPDGPWKDLVEATVASVSEVRVAVQLADRGGPLSAAQLARFRELIEAAAADLEATVAFDDEAAALAAAAELDTFCADNDVAVGLNIVPNESIGLLGTKMRALAESSGFVLAADGAFHLNDERGGTLVALTSMDGVPFEAKSLKALRSEGVTLLLDVPRVGDGRQVFRRMTELARHFAASLDGTVVDDKRTPLTEAGLDKISRQVESIQQALKGRGIVPGSPVALRLFQ